MVTDRSKLPVSLNLYEVKMCRQQAFPLLCELVNSRVKEYPQLKAEMEMDERYANKGYMLKYVRTWAGEDDNDLAGQKLTEVIQGTKVRMLATSCETRENRRGIILGSLTGWFTQIRTVPYCIQTCPIKVSLSGKPVPIDIVSFPKTPTEHKEILPSRHWSLCQPKI